MSHFIHVIGYECTTSYGLRVKAKTFMRLNADRIRSFTRIILSGTQNNNTMRIGQPQPLLLLNAGRSRTHLEENSNRHPAQGFTAAGSPTCNVKLILALLIDHGEVKSTATNHV